MKITQEQQKMGHSLYRNIIAKAQKDLNFKNKLISSPIEAIEKLSNDSIALNKDVSILVEDQTDDSIIYLNIPRKINLDDLELTNEQLELLAGGGLFYDMGHALGAAIRRVGGGGHGYYYTMY